MHAQISILADWRSWIIDDGMAQKGSHANKRSARSGQYHTKMECSVTTGKADDQIASANGTYSVILIL